MKKKEPISQNSGRFAGAIFFAMNFRLGQNLIWSAVSINNAGGAAAHSQNKWADKSAASRSIHMHGCSFVGPLLTRTHTLTNDAERDGLRGGQVLLVGGRARVQPVVAGALHVLNQQRAVWENVLAPVQRQLPVT